MPLVTTLADKTNTRFGKYRPHMMWGIVAWTVITLLMFLVPDFGQMGKTAYYVALLFFWSLACTAFVVPWQSLNSVMSTNVDQRNLMLMLRMLLGTVFATALAMIIPQTIKHIPGAAGYQIVVAAGLVLSLIGGVICISGARHKDYKDSIPTPPQTNLKETLRLFKCRPMLCVALMLGCVYLTSGISSACGIHFYKYVIGDLTPLSITALFGMVAGLLLVPFIPKLYKRISRVNTYILGIALLVVQPVCILLMREKIPLPVLLSTSFLFACGISIANMTVISFIPDCADYSELHMGAPNAGQISSMASFMKKFMNAFSTTIIGVALTVGGYVDGSTVTSPALIGALVAAYAGVPIILSAGGLAALKFFPIKGEYAKQMRQELAVLRAQKSAKEPS